MFSERTRSALSVLMPPSTDLSCAAAPKLSSSYRMGHNDVNDSSGRTSASRAAGRAQCSGGTASAEVLQNHSLTRVPRDTSQSPGTYAAAQMRPQVLHRVWEPWWQVSLLWARSRCSTGTRCCIAVGSRHVLRVGFRHVTQFPDMVRQAAMHVTASLAPPGRK